MVLCIDRSGNTIDWSHVDSGTFGTTTTSGIYGKNDIIDIMFLGKNGMCYSIDPAKYQRLFGSSAFNTQDMNWKPRCNGDHYMPITFRALNRDEINDLNPKIIGDGAGAFDDSDEQLHVSDTFNDFDKRVALMIDPGMTWGCTEFYALYNKITDMSELLSLRGYQMFHPEYFNHYQNWAGYHPASGKYDNYLVVFYLTLPNLLKNLAFMRQGDIPSSIKTLAKIPNNSTISLVTDMCSNPWPENAIFPAGDYYAGQAIYSSNSEFKFVIQADGNCVVYGYKGNVVWASNTSDIHCIFPRMRITDLGGMEINGTRPGGQYKAIINNTGQLGYLHLDAGQGVLTMRDTALKMIRWASVAPSDSGKYDNAAIIKIYNTFTYNTDYPANANTIKYSPNMEYFLKFNADGILEMRRVASSYPTIRKETVIWDTSDKTKGNPNAVLSIQSDGNVVIYSNAAKTNSIWSTGTWGYNKPTFLAADNNGFTAVYGNNSYQGGYILRWTNTGSGDYVKNYNLLVSGMQTNALINTPQSFARACSSATYGSAPDASAINMAQARYCATGLNLITDGQCSTFLSEENGTQYLPDGNGNPTSNLNPNYLAFKNYIMPKVDLICADGYDTQYKDDPATQKKVNQFCSCKNPMGNSKTILNQGWNPICYDQVCIDKGYKTINTVKARKNCPSSICIQDINLTNLQVAKNINVSCAASSSTASGGTKTTTLNSNTNDGTTTSSTSSTSTNTNNGTSTTPADTTITFTDTNVFAYNTDYKAADNHIVYSPNGEYYLTFQSDGNLVLYPNDGSNKVIWSSDTSGNPKGILSIKSDGTINIYGSSSKSSAIWTIRVDGSQPVVLAPDNNGHAVVYQDGDNKWTAVWAHVGISKYTPNSTISVTYTSSSPSSSSDTSNILGIVFTCLLGIIVLLVIGWAFKSKRGAMAAIRTNMFRFRPRMLLGNTMRLQSYNQPAQQSYPTPIYNPRPPQPIPQPTYEQIPQPRYNQVAPQPTYEPIPQPRYNQVAPQPQSVTQPTYEPIRQPQYNQVAPQPQSVTQPTYEPIRQPQYNQVAPQPTQMFLGPTYNQMPYR